MYLHNGIFGYLDRNTTQKFSGYDSEELYLKNRDRLSSTWYYHNKEISYTFNDSGHRCKNINDINTKDYILFTGCSHTVGIGLELDKTYPYLIGKTLNCDYYNIAIGASGPDLLVSNLLTFLSKYPLPKCIFIQWPDTSRFLYRKSLEDLFLATGHWQGEDFRDFAILGDSINYFKTKTQVLFNLVKNLVKIPTINYSVSDSTLDLELDLNSVRLGFLGQNHGLLDLARDLSHFGNKFNAELAQLLIDVYTDKYLNARDNHTS